MSEAYEMLMGPERESKQRDDKWTWSSADAQEFYDLEFNLWNCAGNTTEFLFGRPHQQNVESSVFNKWFRDINELDITFWCKMIKHSHFFAQKIDKSLLPVKYISGLATISDARNTLAHLASFTVSQPAFKKIVQQVYDFYALMEFAVPMSVVEVANYDCNANMNDVRQLAVAYKQKCDDMILQDRQAIQDKYDMLDSAQRLAKRSSVVENELFETQRHLMELKRESDDIVFDLEHKAGKTMKQFNELTKTLADKQKEYEETITEMLESQDEIVNGLKERVQTVSDTNADLQLKLQTVTAANAPLQEQLKTLKATKADLEAELVSAKAVNAPLFEALETLKATKTDLEAQLVSAKAVNAPLFEALETLKATKTDLEAQLVSAKAASAPLFEALETLKATKTDLEAQLVSAKAANAPLFEALETLKATKADLETQLVSAKAASAPLFEALETLKATKTDLEAELVSAKAANAPLFEALETLKATKADLEAELVSAKAANAPLSKALETLKATKTGLEAQLADISLQKEKLKEEVQHWIDSEEDKKSKKRKLWAENGYNENRREKNQVKFQSETPEETAHRKYEHNQSQKKSVARKKELEAQRRLEEEEAQRRLEEEEEGANDDVA